LVEGGRLREESLESALDYGVMQAQQLKEELGRTVQVAPGSTGSILPSSTNSTIGQDSNGDLISRTAQEELDHLGVGAAATAAAASAAAAAISETNAGASETTAVASAAAAEASNVNASAAVLDLASRSFPVVRIGKKLFASNITSDVVLNLPGGGVITLKASARPYTEDNAINAENVDVANMIPDIINIINGDVTDADTGTDYGLSTGATNVDNFTPITDWSAELATDGGTNITDQADLTYYGSEQTTLTVPLPLEVKANATLDPPAALPFSSAYGQVNVKGLGLDETGATSVSDELHELINANGDEPKTIVFPEGATFLCKNIRVPSNTTLKLGSCKFVYGGTNPDSFSFSPENSQSGIFHIYGTEGSPAENVRIIGGELEGSRSASDWSTFAEEDAIQAAWVDRIQIIGTTIHDFQQDAIELKGCSNSVVSSCFIYDCVDAAIELRAGKDNLVDKNHVLRCRNGFMCKPFVKAAGGTNDGQGFTVQDNTFECFGSAILNNWANNSRFLNNDIAPVSVTGEDGLAAVAILHEAHATVSRATNVMEGIETSGNILRGDITNTFMRQVAPSGAEYAHNFAHRNNCVDSCSRFLDLTGVNSISGNHVSSITAPSNVFAINLVPYKGVIISGNHVPAGAINISPAVTASSSVIVDGNICTSVIATGNHMSITGNRGTGVNLDIGVLSAKVCGNTFIYSGVPLDIEADNTVVSDNYFEATADSYVVRLNADKCTLSGNRLVKGSGSITAVETFAGTSDNVITGNNIECGSSTGAGIKLIGDYAKVTHNVIDGGNQNIRISGDNNDIIGNTCRDAVFQNIDVQAGATNNIIDRNTADGTGSGLADAGTGTMTGATSRGF
jgi:hypothetical protein